MKKLSIVMSYYNRRRLLLNTLKSIEYLNRDQSAIEIIIIDDGSNEEHRINDINELFPKLDINLIVLKRDNTDWRNPVTSWNTGLNAVTGDIILINSSECMHFGGIIDYIFRFLDSGHYFAFSTYSVDSEIVNKLNEIDWTTDIIPQMDIAIGQRHSMPENWHDGETGWYSHSKYRSTLIPFCAAITRTDMETLSGFDERFSEGIGFDDCDFEDRVRNLLKPIMIDDPFCIHQAHTLTVYEPTRTQLNRNLWIHLKVDFPNRVKADMNKIYLR